MSVLRGLKMTAIALSCASTSPLLAADTSKIVVEPIFAPLPLYSFAWQETWPRSIEYEDVIGCTSRMAFGDWQLVPAHPDESRESIWERFENYGVFHCAAVMRRADGRAELDEAPVEYGFVVRIGEAEYRSRSWELWVLQRGTMPGSEYTLLARERGGGGVIEEFRALQQICPSNRIREAKSFDIWSTRYCSIGTRAELLALARKMLRLPPRGKLVLMVPVSETSDAPEPVTEEGEHQKKEL